MTYVEKSRLYDGQNNQFDPVQPLPHDNTQVSGSDDDLIAVQPVPSDPKCGTGSDEELTAVQPLPLGPVYASGSDEELTAVQPLPLGPVYASGSDEELTAVQPLPLGPVYASGSDEELTAVQPLPLGPVYASGSDEELTAVQPLPLGPAFASSESTALMMSSTAMTSPNALYNNHQWSIISNDLDLEGLATFDPEIGPTLSQKNVGGDFEAMGVDQVMVETNWHYAVGGFYDKMKIISDGLLVTDADQLKINALDEGHTVHYSKWFGGGSHHYTNHHLYTAIDASNANGYVTYQGVTKDHWQGETHLTGKSYEFHNTFKGGDFGNTIHGGNYGDTLIGGNGDDKIFGVDGDNTIYGVGGDNRIDGGDGGSTIFGGTGNDFIVTGKGENTVVLGDGDNWVVIDQNNLDGTSDANNVMLGTGTDTVVIGNIPASETTVTSSMQEWQLGLVTDTSVDVGSDFVGWASEAMGVGNPIWGMMLSAGNDLISALVGGTPSEVVETTDYPVFQTTEITNFNPLMDRLLLPMNADGSNNLAIRVDDNNGHDLTIYDYNTNSVVSFIDFASAEEIFGTSGSLSAAEKQAFIDSLTSSVLFMDADGLTVGSGDNINSFSVDASDIETIGSFSDDIGAGRYMFAGAWTGNHMFGDSTNSTYMGSVHNDVLFGFDITGDAINAGTGGGGKFYGFAGNNLYATGTGHNLVFGGTGEDTVTYEYALGGIYVDMTDLEIDGNNSSHGMHFTVTQDLDGNNTDFLWNVGNIIGSVYDDEIIGNDEDNTFVSTGGENTWSGTGGDNTFILNGGTTTITDFTTDSDTIIVYGSNDVREDYLTWVENDNDWTLMDADSEQIVVILDKNGDFDGAVEFDFVDQNGSTTFNAPVTTSLESLGHDLIV